VKGNSNCIKAIVEAGADVNKKDNNGKSPKDLAIELKSEAAWKRALRAAGMDEDGRLRLGVLNERNTRLAILGLPTFFFMLAFWTLSIMPWYTGALLAVGEGYAMHHIITRVLLDIKAGEGNKMVKSPYLFSIILGSIAWVFYIWVTRLVNCECFYPLEFSLYLNRFREATPGYAVQNLIFIVSCLLCTYNLIRSATLDPGYVPSPTSDSNLKETIESLVEEGRFDGQNFCLVCLVCKLFMTVKRSLNFLGADLG
jgi:palmitoyltransferase ZDHHC13/17